MNNSINNNNNKNFRKDKTYFRNFLNYFSNGCFYPPKGKKKYFRNYVSLFKYFPTTKNRKSYGLLGVFVTFDSSFDFFKVSAKKKKKNKLKLF